MRNKVLAMVVLCALSVLGCAGSFEEARMAGIKSRSPALSVAPPSARCVSLDNQHRTWGAIGKGAAVLAGVEGVSTIPVDSETGRTALAVGAVVTAAAAATAVYVSEDAGATWARECAAAQ